jgi:mannose-6-phosphate isomerase
LGTVLHKPIGEGDDFAESWEVVDHGQDQSVVAEGHLVGKTLHEIVEQFDRDLFGRQAPQPQFPLLFKLLDCNQSLSVQVHPNDEQAAQLNPPDRGKTEAWVILDAQPGSVIYAGLKPGITRSEFAKELRRGTAAELSLHQFAPQEGDCVFIPAGTVHTLGAGLLVAEIQQASDTTFRLFDWNRVGPDGRPRPLHIEHGLSVIDFTHGPVAPQTPQQVAPGIERLVACDKFVLDRRTFSGEASIGGDERFHIVYVVAGEIRAAGDAAESPLSFGQTILLPACVGEVLLQSHVQATVLNMFLP